VRASAVNSVIRCTEDSILASISFSVSESLCSSSPVSGVSKRRPRLLRLMVLAAASGVDGSQARWLSQLPPLLR